MPHPRPAIWIPLLSLAIALTLLGHDVVMAADPHAPDSHPATGDHAEHDDAPEMQPLAPGHGVENEATCGAFEAARTTERLTEPGDLALGGPAIDVVVDHAAPATQADAAAPSAPPGRLRALLQVWLN